MDSNFWNQVASSVLGGLAGGLFTYLGVKMTISHDRGKSLEDEHTEIQNFKNAVLAELEAIHHRYISSIGKALGEHRKGKPFAFHYPVTEEYFTIFNLNGDKIGRIKDNSLRTKIVKIYVQAKSHLDSLRYNNSLLEQAQQLSLTRSPNPTVGDLQLWENVVNNLSQYGDTILDSHANFVINLEDVIRDLKS